MSVMIKGMDMPESCLKCPFTYEGDCTADAGLTDVYLFLTERHPDCPLSELSTPHGRLIDVAALHEKVDSQPTFWKGAIDEIMVREAPSIIEAEVAEE
jgi:hypothetical protein